MREFNDERIVHSISEHLGLECVAKSYPEP
jgi:hypothetical protein